MKDLYNNFNPVQAFAPGAKNASVTGNVVDTLGYEACVFTFNIGTITDGTHTPVLKDSSDNVTFTAVAGTDLQGTQAALTSGGGNGSNTLVKLGYLGIKRYLRLDVTIAGATTGAVLGAVADLGRARNNPAGATQTP